MTNHSSNIKKFCLTTKDNSFAHPLYGPFLLTEWTSIVLLHPQGHATVVKRVIALAPNYHAILPAVEVLFALRLTTKTRICNRNRGNCSYKESFICEKKLSFQLSRSNNFFLNISISSCTFHVRDNF